MNAAREQTTWNFARATTYRCKTTLNTPRVVTDLIKGRFGTFSDHDNRRLTQKRRRSTKCFGDVTTATLANLSGNIFCCFDFSCRQLTPTIAKVRVSGLRVAQTLRGGRVRCGKPGLHLPTVGRCWSAAHLFDCLTLNHVCSARRLTSLHCAAVGLRGALPTLSKGRMERVHCNLKKTHRAVTWSREVRIVKVSRRFSAPTDTPRRDFL